MLNIQVKCLINRSWDMSNWDWIGDEVVGTLIDVSTQTMPDATIAPVGIIMLEDGSFESIPMDFIQKLEEEQD